MGPHVRLLGPEVPAPQLWQDPVPAADYKLVDAGDITALKRKILASGLSGPQLVRAAWASASTYRDTDKRGGANGARLRLSPQKDWEVNQPAELAKVLAELEKIQQGFNGTGAGGKKISLADLLVLGGNAAVEAAASAAGQTVSVPFVPGRTDATQEQTDANSFAALQPTADGFRNYIGRGNEKPAPELLVERADNLNLTAAELTVLIGGLRALNANHGDSKLGVLTQHPGTLSNEFFVNLLDESIEWQKAPGDEDAYEGRARTTQDVVWTATSVDLVFGANSQLRAIAEVYAANDAKEKFVRDFVSAWTKVMSLGRFDVEAKKPAAVAAR
jgi:catalase-peroxidase